MNTEFIGLSKKGVTVIDTTEDGRLVINCRKCNDRVHIIKYYFVNNEFRTTCYNCSPKKIAALGNSKIIAGQQYGYLIPLYPVPHITSHRGRHWHCKCLKCGGFSTVRADALKNGHTATCGCSKVCIDGVSMSSILFFKKIESVYNVSIQYGANNEYQIKKKRYDGKWNNYLFEIDGKPWHSSDKNKQNDLHKNKLAEDAGFTLIRIPLNCAKEVETRFAEYKHILDQIFLQQSS